MLTQRAGSAGKRRGNLRPATRFDCSGHLEPEPQNARTLGRNPGALHSFCEEAIPWYKTVVPLRPSEPKSYLRYHSKRGYTVIDQDMIVVPARDLVYRTKRGAVRESSGHVTYSAQHCLEMELDAEALSRILRDVPSGGTQPEWPLPKLEKAFKDKVGRKGSWTRYQVPLRDFLALFPRTFEVFRSGNKVHACNVHRSRAKIIDKGEEAMIRLALAGQGRLVDRTGALTPESLQSSMVHVKFKPQSREPTTLHSSSRPQQLMGELDATQIAASTQLQDGLLPGTLDAKMEQLAALEDDTTEAAMAGVTMELALTQDAKGASDIELVPDAAPVATDA